MNGLKIRINKLHESISSHPEYSSKVLREVTGSIRREAQRHSLGIELASEKICPNEVDMKGFETRLDEAWAYLVNRGISTQSLSVLGSLIEPTVCTSYFRRSDVKFGGFTPPNWERVDQLVDNLVYRLEEVISFPLQAAIEAHIEFVRIHPYNDGNGRASRIIQNYILFKEGFPPPVIKVNERELYFGLLGEVLKDRYNQKSSIEEPSRAESLFQVFIGTKVYDSFERLNNELERRRMYSIQIMDKDIKLGRSCASRLRSYGRRIGAGVSVSVSRREDGKINLDIVGDISREHLRVSIKQTLGSKDIPFRIYKVH